MLEAASLLAIMVAAFVLGGALYHLWLRVRYWWQKFTPARAVIVTDAELEELEALLAKATPGEWVADYHFVRQASLAPGRIADEIAKQEDADLIAFGVNALPSLLSTIRTLKAEVEAQRAPVTPEALAWAKEEAERIERREAAKDRVVEAARVKLATEDKVNGNIAFGVHDEDDAKAHAEATKALQSALSALDQEDKP